ncbi:hypothetical protein AB1Y20_019613 [Prymnesium parvum]|uniref:SAM-dependent MTase RsmB/NOP-type domain-containing protein n=1 Tax=Prymnesium parvum TaxID=97485 RepID=A0AB34JSC5_PRYPA
MRVTPRRLALEGFFAAALLHTASPRPSAAFVEGVCLDGQQRWRIYRECVATGGAACEASKPYGACEEFAYYERPAFKALDAASMERSAARLAREEQDGQRVRESLGAFRKAHPLAAPSQRASAAFETAAPP